MNSCGRTEINGNIDVGEQTENELAAKRVTQVSGGTVMTVTIHQVGHNSLFDCLRSLTFERRSMLMAPALTSAIWMRQVTLLLSSLH